jgi:hypothetical protein
MDCTLTQSFIFICHPPADQGIDPKQNLAPVCRAELVEVAPPLAPEAAGP